MQLAGRTVAKHDPRRALIYAAKVEAIQQLYMYMAVRTALIPNPRRRTIDRLGHPLVHESFDEVVRG
jgi:hypothetical protein